MTAIEAAVVSLVIVALVALWAKHRSECRLLFQDAKGWLKPERSVRSPANVVDLAAARRVLRTDLENRRIADRMAGVRR